MRRATLFVITTVAAMMIALTLGVAAQQPDTHDRTIMTFSAPVELPGMRLDAGTYVWRIADTPNRNVIQVFDKDERNIMGQWLFVSAERPAVTGDTVVTFKETSAGSTPAVHFWYYPGEKIGKELIYPKDQALRIARRTGATVLTAEGPVTGGDVNVAAATTTAQPESRQASAAPEPQVAPAQDQGAVAIGTGGADQNANNRDNVRQESTVASNELPKTAGLLPLTGLISLISLGGAAVIRRFRL